MNDDTNADRSNTQTHHSAQPHFTLKTKDKESVFVSIGGKSTSGPEMHRSGNAPFKHLSDMAVAVELIRKKCLRKCPQFQ